MMVDTQRVEPRLWSSLEWRRTHAHRRISGGMPRLACQDVLSLPYRHVNYPVPWPLRTWLTTHLPTNTWVLMNAYWVLEPALNQKNQSFEPRKREPKMFHSTKCSKSASKDSPLGSSWAPTWPSKSTKNRLKAKGFARHQTSSSLSASLFTRKCSSGLHFWANKIWWRAVCLIFRFALKNQYMYNPEKARSP